LDEDVWSVKLKVPGQEVDQRKLGEKRLSGMYIEQGGCHGS